MFTRLLGDYLSYESYRELQRALMENPELGDVGGFRKARWHDARRGKGKRGGWRVIYYYLTADHQIWFFTLYDKDEAADEEGDRPSWKPGDKSHETETRIVR